MSKNSSFVELINQFTHLHECDVINTKFYVELVDLAIGVYSAGKYDKDLALWAKGESA